MKRQIIILLGCLLAIIPLTRANGKIPTIYVDRQGVMRWSDTKTEASFFGVNYTLPFAHAYRAMGYLGVDRKAAIDRDVYHLARLGINAYRIHIWDVEISDAKGNLQENEHLDLLDYLFSKLEERGIRILITLQTNFGNGYPERNEPTGGYSYRYDKCSIHQDPEAIAAQHVDRLVRLVGQTPRERYFDLLRRVPDVFSRVSLRDVAAYVGIDPATLSRMRTALLREPRPKP